MSTTFWTEEQIDEVRRIFGVSNSEFVRLAEKQSPKELLPRLRIYLYGCSPKRADDIVARLGGEVFDVEKARSYFELMSHILEVERLIASLEDSSAYRELIVTEAAEADQRTRWDVGD